jgi:hypothetical protein
MLARDITRDCELLLALALALFALARAEIVRAEPCPAEAALRERVVRQLDDPTALSSTELAITVEELDGRYRLTLDTEHEGAHGTRVFEGVSCEEVVDAGALLLVLMLDQERSEASSVPAPAPRAALPTPAPAPPRRRAHATLRAAVLGELGYLPRAGVGAELAVGVALRRARIELTGLWLPDVRSEREPDGARVAIGLWTARLGYCQRLLGRRVALFGCLGLELGQAHGQGLGLTQERERTYLWSAGHGGLRASFALGRSFALLLEPALAVPFARRRFVSVDASGAPSERLHTPAPVSGRLAIALEALF